MITAQELLSKKLKAKGYSVTKPRLVTFEALSASPQPLTMQELIRRTVKEIDRASVYRSVEVLEKSGVTQRLYNGWKYKVELSDSFQEHHHHFTCTNCGTVIPLHDQDIEKIIDNLAKDINFEVTAHQIEIQGLCRKCR